MQCTSVVDAGGERGEERRGEENVKWRLSGGRQRGRHSVVADRDGKEKRRKKRRKELLLLLLLLLLLAGRNVVTAKG